VTTRYARDLERLLAEAKPRREAKVAQVSAPQPGDGLRQLAGELRELAASGRIHDVKLASDVHIPKAGKAAPELRKVAALLREAAALLPVATDAAPEVVAVKVASTGTAARGLTLLRDRLRGH
jgi:hypothetical protein